MVSVIIYVVFLLLHKTKIQFNLTRICLSVLVIAVDHKFGSEKNSFHGGNDFSTQVHIPLWVKKYLETLDRPLINNSLVSKFVCL